MVEVDFFASRMVALPDSYSMKYRRLAVGSSIIASGCNLRLSRRGSAAANWLNGRSRYSPNVQWKPLGTFAGILPSCGTSPRKISLSITSCFKKDCPTSCFGIRSSFSPSHCDPISKPSAVKAQTVVHPAALPYPRSPRITAACPPMLDANCLSLVDDLALLLPGNISLSICSRVRYRHTAKNPHNSPSLSSTAGSAPPSFSSQPLLPFTPPRHSHFPATRSSRWEWVAGKGRRRPRGLPAARIVIRQAPDSAGRNRQQHRHSANEPPRAPATK